MAGNTPDTPLEAIRSDHEWVVVRTSDSNGTYHEFDAERMDGPVPACRIGNGVGTPSDRFRFLRKDIAEDWREPCSYGPCEGPDPRVRLPDGTFPPAESTDNDEEDTTDGQSKRHSGTESADD